MTGFTHLEFDGDQSPLMSKLFELMLELSPRLRSAAIMFNPQNPAHSFHVRTFNDVAARRNITPFEIRIAGISDIDSGIADFSSKLDSVALLPSDVTLLAHRAAIVAAMAWYRVQSSIRTAALSKSAGSCLMRPTAWRCIGEQPAMSAASCVANWQCELPVQQPTAMNSFSIFGRLANWVLTCLPPSLPAPTR